MKWLEENEIDFREIPIREQPPSKVEMKEMLAAHEGEIRKLFNTSGQDYRAMGLKDRLPELSDEEAIGLLCENGNLVKRPFLVSDRASLVGFKEDVWAEKLT